MDCSPSISAPSPKVRWAIFVVLALLALSIRLPQLGERPMHTDESINAFIIGQSLAGKEFHYDPKDRHGPALTAFTLPLLKLAGAKDFASLTESQLRLSTVLAGTATVLLFGAAVEMFGFVVCFLAAVLFTFAPLTIYYHRYFIHESFFVLATFGLILSVWRAIQRKSVALAALAGACAALMLANKETAPLHFIALGLAALAVRFWSVRMRLRLGADTATRQDNGLLPAHPNLFKMALAATAAFLLIVVLFFTWFGQNWQVFHDLWQAVGNFTARAGGQGHEKPCWYYAKLLCDGWAGTVILILSLLGMLSVITQLMGRPKLQPLAPRIFLVVYALVIFAIYSAIPYKTPWLALNFWLPLALLAAITIECAWFATTKCLVRSIILLLLIGLGYLLQHDIRLRVFVKPADEKNPYAYAHTVDDLLDVPEQIETIARQRNISEPRISVIMADAWPLPWYLRKFSQVGFWQPEQEPAPADFYITSAPPPPSLRMRLEHFRGDYYGVRPEVPLILWTPEVKRD